jgi:hypothetical protein
VKVSEASIYRDSSPIFTLTFIVTSLIDLLGSSIRVTID